MIQLVAAYLAKAALVLAAAAALAWIARPSSAALRHAVWTAGLASALLLFPVSLLLPRLHLGLTESGAAGAAASVLVSIWLAAATFLMLRILLDQLALHRVAAAAEPVTDEEVADLAAEAAVRMGVRRRVRLRRWQGAMPATFGTFRPIVLLPAASPAWPPERIRLVLLHEMAHIARLDTAALMLGRIVQALHWFNPLSWRCLRCLRAECEEACDARVLDAGAEPLAYARALLETLSDGSGAAPRGALAMTATEALARRLRRICRRDHPPRGKPTWPAVLALSIIAALLLAPLRFEEAGSSSYEAASAP